MKDRDDTLLEEAYGEIQEGIFDRMKARKGTYKQQAASGLASMAGKGLQKLGSKGTGRMADMAKTAGQNISDIGAAGKMDVEEQKAQQLMAIYGKRVEKAYLEMRSDAQKVGIDLDKLAQQDFQSKGSGGDYPKMAGLSEALRLMNDVRRILGGN